MTIPYKRGYSFSGFQSNQPAKPLPGLRVDVELDDIATALSGLGYTLDELIATVRKITGTPGGLLDLTDVRNYGFIGDGASHPLSSKFPTLRAAQAIYPRATSLANEIDGLAIQKCIDTQAPNGKARVSLPPCDALTTNDIDFTGLAGVIAGAGPAHSQVRDQRSGRVATLRQGSEAAGQGQPLFADGVTFKSDAADPSQTIGFFVRHDRNAGILQALSFRDVIFNRYGANHIYDVGRGLDFYNVIINGPDFSKQPNGGIIVRGRPGNTWGMFSHRYYNVIVSNYRWGWDYQVANCAIEGHSFFGCAAYNGDGMVNVDCNGLNAQGDAGYKCLLWSFDNCDWQGLGYAIQMKNCRNVRISGGFFIYDRPYVSATDTLYRQDNSAYPAGFYRTMFNFIACDDVASDRAEFAAGDMLDSFLVQTDVDCYACEFKNSVVRTYGNASRGGFILSGGEANTTIERGTKWRSWSGGNKAFYVGNIPNYQQISETDADRQNGTVTDQGIYSFRGSATVTTDANGLATIPLPLRYNAQPFFQVPPTVIISTVHGSTAIGMPTIRQTYPDRFDIMAQGAQPNFTFGVFYEADGK